MCLRSSECRLCPGMHAKQHGQQGSGENPPGPMCPTLGSPTHKYIPTCSSRCREGPIIRSDHLPFDNRLGVGGCSAWRREKLQGDLRAAFPALMGDYRKDKNVCLSGHEVTGQRINLNGQRVILCPFMCTTAVFVGFLKDSSTSFNSPSCIKFFSL